MFFTRSVYFFTGCLIITGRKLFHPEGFSIESKNFSTLISSLKIPRKVREEASSQRRLEIITDPQLQPLEKFSPGRRKKITSHPARKKFLQVPTTSLIVMITVNDPAISIKALWRWLLGTSRVAPDKFKVPAKGVLRVQFAPEFDTECTEMPSRIALSRYQVGSRIGAHCRLSGVCSGPHIPAPFTLSLAIHTFPLSPMDSPYPLHSTSTRLQ